MKSKMKVYKFSVQFICCARNEDEALAQFLEEYSDRNSYLNDTGSWEVNELEDTPETHYLYDGLDQ